MKYLLKWCCCLLLVLLSSCKNEGEIYTELLEGLNKVNIKLTEGETDVIIIPGAGCGGCISLVTSYVLDHIDTLSSNVVFTGVGDMKLFRLEVGKEFLTNPKVFVDTENFLMNTKISSIYPRQLMFNGNKIEKVIDFSPEPW